jgi:hypothetical protein
MALGWTRHKEVFVRKRITLASIPAAAAVAVLATACEGVESSPAATATAIRGVCSGGGVRVTGGGRIDPNLLDKVTFGFTVDGTSGPPFRGQLQTVFHFMLLKAHSVSIDAFERDQEDCSCVKFRGDVATSDGDRHHFRAVACDKAEPGSSPGRGPDKFGICIDQHRSTDPMQPPPFPECNDYPEPTELTGGNIQLH